MLLSSVIFLRRAGRAIIEQWINVHMANDEHGRIDRVYEDFDGCGVY